MSVSRRSFVTLVGLVVACSESGPPVGPEPEEAGVDAAICGSAPCMGICRAERCLVELASVASPGHVLVDDSRVYFTTCSPDGTGGVLTASLEPGVPPMSLTAGNHCPGGAAIYGGNFYAAGLSANEVTRIPLYGGPTSVIGSAPGITIGVAVDDTSAYVTTESGSLTAIPIRGGIPLNLVSGEKSMTAPAVDATDVYFGSRLDGTVKKVPRGGGAATTLATVDTVAALALSETEVFLAAGYIVAKIPKAGGQPTTLGTAAGADIVAIAVDDTNVYFASYAEVWKIPLGGGPTEPLVGGQSDVTSIAVDATSVYLTNKAASPDDPTACCGRVVKLTPK